jgi:hypothetical protein
MRRTAWFIKAQDVASLTVAILVVSVLAIFMVKALPIIEAAKMAVIQSLK